MNGSKALSTEDVIRVAIKRYLEFSFQGNSDLSWLDHFCGNAPVSFSEDDAKNVELVHLLLASAERVGCQQFDRASRLLIQCDHLSSRIGNAVQRIVHYFGAALREKIDRETGRIISKKVEGKEMSPLRIEETVTTLNPAYIACFLKLPFYQVSQFAGIQAITESVASAKRVHFIDLAIRCGGHCMVLMQALATRRECPVELLKITVVGTTTKNIFEETGKRLAYFAETLNLPFSFKIAIVTNIKDLKEDMFDLNKNEVVAIYSTMLLNHIIRKPDYLESLITVLKNTNPCVMVVTEVEANHNLETFEDRFFEALFYYSALFDCLDVCMNRCDRNRMMLEEMCIGKDIGNIIAAEGEDRIFGHMKIDAWRVIFKRFGMVEAELSTPSLYHAELMVKKFSYGNSCTFDRNGKCLIIGWKGSPHLSLSVWKFRQDKRRICNMDSKPI